MYTGNKNSSVAEKVVSDGGQYVLKCLNCEAPLLIVWVTRPKANKYQWNVKCNCPYCQHESEEKTFYGLFHYGPYYDVTNEETMENESDLYIEGFTNTEEGVVVQLKRHEK